MQHTPARWRVSYRDGVAPGAIKTVTIPQMGMSEPPTVCTFTGWVSLEDALLMAASPTLLDGTKDDTKNLQRVADLLRGLKDPDAEDARKLVLAMRKAALARIKDATEA